MVEFKGVGMVACYRLLLVCNSICRHKQLRLNTSTVVVLHTPKSAVTLKKLRQAVAQLSREATSHICMAGPYSGLYIALHRRVTSQTRRKKIRENVHKIYFMNVFANPLVNGFVASLHFL